MVAVFMPGLKLTLGAASPDHQSHADFPARIHEVSAIFEGGFKLSTMLDSMRRPGSSPIMRTRQGLVTVVSAFTAMVGASICGESSARKPRGVSAFRKYMPAKLSILASVTAIHPTAGTSASKGSATN